MSNLILVDEYDNPIGTAEKILVHQLGKLHRAFSVFVFRKINDNLQLLLQKRHVSKYHSGGLWSNSCCGHPEIAEENVVSAAKRRLTEELGIQVELKSLGSFIYQHQFLNGLIEHELDHVLVGTYQHDVIRPDPSEVDDFNWEDVNNFDYILMNDATKNNFTVWLRPAWGIVRKHLSI